MMKIFIITLILGLTVTLSKATQNKIIAEVVFENLTDKMLTYGEFYITETNERIKIENTKSFNIALPVKGKYQFTFSTKEFTAYTFYPSIITNKKNMITIRLVERNEHYFNNKTFSFPMNMDTNQTDEQIEERIADGTLNFIIHGIDSSIPNEYITFKEKYDIGVIKENCVVDPISFKRVSENNQLIKAYLDHKYGEDWINELPAKPFGIR